MTRLPARCPTTSFRIDARALAYCIGVPDLRARIENEISMISATAGLTVGALGISGAAGAQRYNDDRDHGRFEQRGDRGDRGRHYGRNNRGHHYGSDRHQRCRTEWRHHHRVRICR
jgi:hypothetical protein